MTSLASACVHLKNFLKFVWLSWVLVAHSGSSLQPWASLAVARASLPCGILLRGPGTESMSPALEAGVYHWTSREVPPFAAFLSFLSEACHCSPGLNNTLLLDYRDSSESVLAVKVSGGTAGRAPDPCSKRKKVPRCHAHSQPASDAHTCQRRGWRSTATPGAGAWLNKWSPRISLFLAGLTGDLTADVVRVSTESLWKRHQESSVSGGTVGLFRFLLGGGGQWVAPGQSSGPSPNSGLLTQVEGSGGC